MRRNPGSTSSRFSIAACRVLLALVLGGAIAVATPAYAAQTGNPHGHFKGECALCHSARGWNKLSLKPRFDHGVYGMALTGAHASNDCKSCHTSVDFTSVRPQCVTCHEDPHRGENGADCAHCHGTRSFTDRAPMVRLHQLTQFPLTEAHTTVACESCHKPSAQGQMQYKGTSVACASCHMDNYRSAKAPDHVTMGFPTDCKSCHKNMQDWRSASFAFAKFGSTDFTHPASFPLTNAHAGRQCDDCHKGNYISLVNNCYSCHQTMARSYDNVTNPIHTAPSFGTSNAACLGCHNTVAWQPSLFAHPAAFPLTNAHAGRQCVACHGTGVYTGTSVTCISCHQNSSPGYASATNPVHEPTNFPTSTCTGCHNTVAWRPASLFTHPGGFPMLGNHSRAVRQCDDCHSTIGYTAKSSDSDCITCHANSNPGYNNPGPTAPVHTPASFPSTTSNCVGCHSQAATAFVSWAGGSGFDHTGAGFPLTNAHSGVACETCHKGNYSTTVNNCYSCHETLAKSYSSAVNPPHSTPAFGTDNASCAGCHNTTAFSPSKFKHVATFPLTNAHASQLCESCHAGNYVSLLNSCYSCHQGLQKGYGTATNPPHSTPAFGQDNAACTTCHSTTAFSPSKWSHPATFALSNAHAGRLCEDCHKSNYATLANNCYSCHQAAYAAATSAKHTPTNFPTTNAACTGCHNTVAFSPATFSHAANTTFVSYTGKHTSLLCTDCHNASTWNVLDKGTNCYGCHSTDYANAVPAHNPTSYPQAGCTCHNTAGWPGATSFDHTTVAGFSLAGAHNISARQCNDCHQYIGNTPKATDVDCITCHLNSTPGYNNTGLGNPVHNASFFPSTTAQCRTCHASAATSYATWAGGTYTHTSMQLTNAHAGRLCEDCHKGNYTTIAFSCIGCHQSTPPGYATATNPPHSSPAFGTTNAACLACHNTVAFSPATFAHPTTFPLSNAHAGRLCQDCHAGNYTSLVNNCYTCHQNSTPGYANATNPPHTPLNFPTTLAACTGCHNTVAFTPATWPANHSTTAFAASFNGAHPAQPCTACHNSANWSVLATGNNCYGCHSASYASATPVHDPVNYPQAGCACHSTTTWLNATSFDHSTVGFSMTGLHALTARACSDCHSIISYTAKSTDKDCITCHATAYNSPGAGVPVHSTQASFFPSTTASCITCHATANTSHTSWLPGKFANHTWFPITTGRHAGIACMDCHNAVANLATYSCAKSCHTSALANHPNKSGFSLTTVETQCYVCHKSGSAG